MTAATAASTQTTLGRFSALPNWTWSVAALAVIAVQLILITGDGMSGYLGDTDDAARLVQVREFINGAPWFNLSTTRMGGQAGMLSHWSRLIDLPVAAIITMMSAFTSAATAELVARAVWPLMVLAPFLLVIQTATTAQSGAAAGRIALALAVLLPLGLAQFILGRIDHHNVMIAATVSAALLMWAYPASIQFWAVAGGLNGFALVIGYEALAPAAALAVIAALWGLTDRRQARAVQGFMIAMMMALAAGFVVSIPPSRWMDVRCDAISLNIVALSAIAGLVLCAALKPQRNWTIAVRFGVAAAGAVVGLAAYGMLEPKCLAGPMGQLPADLGPLWLDYVTESRSLLVQLINGRFETSLGFIAFVTAGLAAQTARVRTTGSVADLFLLAVVAAFVAFACWQYKYVAYASFIALVPVACWISTLTGNASIRPAAMQLIAAVALCQLSLLGAGGLLQKVFPSLAASASKMLTGKAEDCERNDAVRDLAALPPGLIAGHIDLGAYVVAGTPHRVLSAPYHRIADAIITNQRIFAARVPADAARLLARENVDYVVTCKGLDDPFVGEAEWLGTLRANLVAGQPPAFLEPVALDNKASLFRVWRVAKDKLNLQP